MMAWNGGTIGGERDACARQPLCRVLVADILIEEGASRRGSEQSIPDVLRDIGVVVALSRTGEPYGQIACRGIVVGGMDCAGIEILHFRSPKKEGGPEGPP